jgi:hypothetical protein
MCVFFAQYFHGDVKVNGPCIVHQADFSIDKMHHLRWVPPPSKSMLPIGSRAYNPEVTISLYVCIYVYVSMYVRHMLVYMNIVW